MTRSTSSACRKGLKHLHVLMEPMSCAAKAVQQAYEVQRRMRVWRPQRAFVLGAGQIGLLATLVLRLRGSKSYTLARGKPGTLSSRDRGGAGGDLRQHRAKRRSEELAEADRQGRPDHRRHRQQRRSPSARWSYLGHNGVLVWTSITGGDRKHRSAVGQDQPRLGAGQQAAARLGERQPRALRNGHQGPGPGRSDVPRRDAARF